MNTCEYYEIRDSSAIYGSNSKAMDRVRTYKDGKLKLSEETGLLLQDQDGLAISGDVRNSWVGVSALQALFIKEHNAVCDALKVNICFHSFCVNSDFFHTFIPK